MQKLGVALCLALALLAISCTAETTPSVELFELDPTGLAVSPSPKEAKIAHTLLALREKILPLHEEICKDETSPGCVLRTRANAEIIQDVLSRRCYRKSGCAAAAMGKCAKTGCTYLERILKQHAALQQKYTNLYKKYMQTYARYYRRRFKRLARVARATRRQMRSQIRSLKKENEKLATELKIAETNHKKASDEADKKEAAIRHTKGKLTETNRQKLMALAAIRKERALVRKLKAGIRATARAARSKGAAQAKSRAAKISFLTKHMRAAKRRADHLGRYTRALGAQVRKLRVLLRNAVSKARRNGAAASRASRSLQNKIRGLNSQIASWKKRLSNCQRGTAASRRAHANLKRKHAQLSAKANKLKQQQHQNQINAGAKNGWVHVMTMGSAAVLSSRAVGNKNSDAFKLSDAAINRIGGKAGVQLKIDFNGKEMFVLPVSGEGKPRPFATRSNVAKFKWAENQPWQGPCGHSSQNTNYYFFFMKTKCRYGQKNCKCASGNFESGVGKKGFFANDRSGFFPMSGWAPTIKVFAKKYTAGGLKTTYVTRYTGADGREHGYINNRILDFNKESDDTDLKLAYYDNLRVHNGRRRGCHCRWELRIDGRSCPSGGVAGEVYLWANGNLHRPRLVTGYCKRVRRGRHRLQVRVQSWSADCYTGWYTQQTGWTLEATEIPNNHKELGLYYRTAYTGADGREHGYINNRILNFEKKFDNTPMRFLYYDNLRTHAGGGGHSCRWQVRIDGRQCPSGNIGVDVYIWGAKNTHRPRVVMGYCKGIRRGRHTMRIQSRHTPGYGGDCYTGWRSSINSWTMEAEEILQNQAGTRHFRTAYGPHDGRDHGWVTNRRLDFNKRGNGPLKLTYQDNMRTYSPNWHGRSCRWEIRVDGRRCPSGMIAGDVYVYHENAHRPRVVTGFCRGVRQGRHYIAVYVSPTPHYGGSDCYTGWYTQQTSWTLEAIEVDDEK